jgi:hypothetical protein
MITMSTNLRLTRSEGRMAPVPADAFITALRHRDFDAIARLLTDDVRMRAVLPSRYLEAIGGEVIDSFNRWFGGAERFEVIATGSEDIAGRARVEWRFRVAPHPLTHAPGWHEIEQVAFLETSAGLVSRIDLVCSGYRPVPQPWIHCDR